MDNLFKNFNQVVRYLASGIVALAAAHLFNNQCLKSLNHNLGADTNWWPMLFIAATAGLLVQAFNSTLLWWIFPLMLKLRAIRKQDADTERATGSEQALPATQDQGAANNRGLRKYAWIAKILDTCSMKEFRRYNHQRWLRRVSKDPQIQGIQNEIDRWGALIHFLYCSGLAMILTPLAMSWCLQIERTNKPWRVFEISSGVLLIIALIGDRFKLARECWLSDIRPENDPTDMKEKPRLPSPANDGNSPSVAQ